MHVTFDNSGVHGVIRNNASENRKTTALNLLESRGYNSFADFKSDGEDYTAVVSQYGHDVSLLIDPEGSRVMPQN